MSRSKVLLISKDMRDLNIKNTQCVELALCLNESLDPNNKDKIGMETLET